jgi:hypothetical protein
MRPLSAAILAAAMPVAPLCFFLACGGGSSGNSADAGSDVVDEVPIRRDTGTGSSSGGDSGGVLIPPTGTQLVPTMNLLQVDAVTDDGYAIYTDTSDNSVWAIQVTSGTPQMPQKITSNVSSSAIVTANGPVVLIWANLDATFTTGQLIVWTAAKGPQMLSTASNVGAAISKDQSHIVFMDGSTATSTAIAVAGVDGTGKMTLVPTAVVSTACSPAVGFVANDALAAYCTAAPAADAGANDATLTRYAATTWMGTNISTSAFTGFSANQTGDHVLFFDNAGLEAYDVAAGTTALIDAAGDSYVITPDGTKVVYGTIAAAADGGAAGTFGPFKVSPIAMPSATTLGTGIAAFYGISPDGNWVLGFTQQTMTTMFTNTILGSTTTAGMPTTLVSQATSSPIGDDFTSDSKFAIYTDSITPTMTVSGNVTSGNLNVVPLTGAGAMPIQLGTAVWQEAAGLGSKVIFNPNWTPPANLGLGVADLTAIDLSVATPAAKTLVTQADANFYLTKDKGTIVYSFSTGGGGQPTAMSGLWAMPVP